MQLRILLQYDWQFAKKGEPHFRAFEFFLISLILISYSNIKGWIDIPHLNDQMLFGIPVSWGIILYSSIIIISTLNPNIMTLFWESIFIFSDKSVKYSEKNTKLLLLGFLMVIIGFFLFLFWTILFNIFPLILAYYFVLPNIQFLLVSFPTNLLILILFLFILNYLVEFIALIFGVNLVENVLNEKIWWLEKIKMDLSNINNDTHSLKTLYKKLEFSDLYTPIPINRYLIFQKYVFFPNWILKEWIDIENCDDLDFMILKERFQSQKMALYEKRPFYDKPR
jgi:uncharacterized protein with PQ loop repeat